MDVTAVDALSALNLEFHVVLAGRFAILALLPAVAIPSVADLFPRVQQHRATFGSRFHLLGLPLGMFVEADEDGGDFLISIPPMSLGWEMVSPWQTF